MFVFFFFEEINNSVFEFAPETRQAFTLFHFPGADTFFVY
jgi:hypothetical protein